MDLLTKKALAGLAFLQVTLGLLLFLPAHTLRFWQAWAFLLVFGGATLAITLYFLKRDPALLERRVKAGPGAETQRSQQIIQALASTAWCALFVVAGLDHRHGWSAVPAPLALAADAIVAIGLGVVFFVFRANGHASATIEVQPGQRVITTGLYRFVRHPMYAGAMLMLLATPPALGSLWALAAVLVLDAAVVGRLLAEERFLSTSLPGYAEYRERVRFRLLPGIW